MSSTLINGLYVFMLAAFIGFEVIRRVSPLLHTPLMSLTNALDAIAVVGRDRAGRRGTRAGFRDVLGMIAIVAATSNIVGGFLITDRMLRMFKQPPDQAMNTLPVTEHVIEITYLVASALFILSLKWMSSPSTARRGVWAGEIGMLLAIGGTLLHHGIVDYRWIAIALVLGTIIGVPLGLVQMTAVPQRTALSHAFGALCVTLVGTAEFYLRTSRHAALHDGRPVAGGHPRFADLHRQPDGRGQTAGDPAAAADHLQGPEPRQPVLLAVAVGWRRATWSCIPARRWLFPVMMVISLLFGVLMIIPIGGADMPTVISLLNSYAGLSAAAMGFVLDSKLLIIAGALDGSSGFILSVIMSKAMNRSFTNVLFGAFGQVQPAAVAGQEARPVRSATAEEAAAILAAANRVVIVPGYGMAVAQAQHKVRELFDALTQARRGREVRHPSRRRPHAGAHERAAGRGRHSL